MAAVPRFMQSGGIEAGTTEPAVVVAAYRPDPSQWSGDFEAVALALKRDDIAAARRLGGRVYELREVTA